MNPSASTRNTPRPSTTAATSGRKGDLDRAIADYNEAIRLDAKFALAYANRGDAWDDKGDSTRAIADLDQAIRHDPKYSRAYNVRGVVWKKKGDLDRAIEDFTDAIRLDPKSPSPTPTAATPGTIKATRTAPSAT